jgi:ClpP class serine protease
MSAQAVIKKEEKGWVVYSENGKRLGGPYKTKEEAEKRLQQVEYFKHKDASGEAVGGAGLKATYMNMGCQAMAQAAWGAVYDLAPPVPYEICGSVAVVCISGPLVEHLDPFWQSYECIEQDARAAFASEAKSVLLRINSRGGDAAGCMELARTLRQLSEETGKPLVTYADGMMASAAYAIGSAAQEIVCPPTATVGSIGVFEPIIDLTEQDRAAGVKITFVASGKLKLAGNPYDTTRGLPSLANWTASPGSFYANWLTGSAQSAVGYPGACPIDTTQTIDVAFQNLSKAIAYSRGLKMPNGRTPRFLTPAAIICPPAMTTRVSQLLGAYSMSANYVMPQAATGGAGSATMDGMIRRWGLGDPIEASEIAATTNYQTEIQLQATNGSGVTNAFTETITGSDTTWYLVMKANQSSTLGGLIHVLREGFKMNLFSGDGAGGPVPTGLDAILNRALEIEYHAQGRVSVQPGHPYAIFRVDQA